jgi:hypothetical protein
VSTADQTCARQERDLRAFAKKAGYKIVGVWKAGSGAKDDRAERKKILALAKLARLKSSLLPSSPVEAAQCSIYFTREAKPRSIVWRIIDEAIVRSPRRFDRRLYLGASLIFFALVFWTFARTFYLKPFFGTPPLSALLHIQGAVMTGWVVLLVVQTSLAAHRV